jgi:hypothetical protein
MSEVFPHGTLQKIRGMFHVEHSGRNSDEVFHVEHCLVLTQLAWLSSVRREQM